MREDTRSSLLLWSLSSFLGSLLALSGDTGLVLDFGTLAFSALLNCTVVDRRQSNDSSKLHKTSGGSKVTDQEGWRFLANSTSDNRHDTTRRFTSPHFNIQLLKQPWIVLFFLLCLLKLGFFGTGTGDDISAFLFLPWRWKHTRLDSEPQTHHSD